MPCQPREDAGGLSARQLARKKNENGTHEAILQILNEHTASRLQRLQSCRDRQQAHWELEPC